jgi:transcriptional regulator with XRE-family HTH domain
MSDLGDKVRELRQAQHMSMRELAKRGNCGVTLVARIEQGIGVYVTAEQVAQLARGLDVPIRDLFDLIPACDRDVKYFRIVPPAE